MVVELPGRGMERWVENEGAPYTAPDLHGSVGAFIAGEPTPTKRIGFRMPEPEPTPDWMLF